MKSWLLYTAIFLVSAFSIFTILVIWVPDICSLETYLKALLTFIIIEGALVSLWLLKRDIQSEDYQRKNKFTDS